MSEYVGLGMKGMCKSPTAHYPASDKGEPCCEIHKWPSSLPMSHSTAVHPLDYCLAKKMYWRGTQYDQVKSSLWNSERKMM